MALIRTQQQFVKFMGSDLNKVSNSGFTAEEFKSSKGRADPDARLNPLPKSGVVDKIYPNPQKTSDRGRLESPPQLVAEQAAQEEVRLTHFFVRSALKRTRGKINEFMRGGFGKRRGALGERAKQMEASFSRLDKMAETLEFYDDLAAGVLNRVLSHQKG